NASVRGARSTHVPNARVRSAICLSPKAGSELYRTLRVPCRTRASRPVAHMTLRSSSRREAGADPTRRSFALVFSWWCYSGVDDAPDRLLERGNRVFIGTDRDQHLHPVRIGQHVVHELAVARVVVELEAHCQRATRSSASD